jgi:hypothetical protein
MNIYQHTQRGALIIVSLLGMAAGMAVGGCFAPPLFAAVPILLLTAWLFHSLTIELTGEELRWRFGPGIVAKRVPLAEIASARVVQTTFLEGWGIHWSRFGWLYNVSGRDAVAIGLRNGKKFALGTDEPEALGAIIQQNLR